MVALRIMIIILQLTLLAIEIAFAMPLLCIPIVGLALLSLRTYWEEN
ncbi:MAG: hypothetical protein RBR71_03670 [Gudongella sp.]|nr:hypothetical protein [Gudongella sp.]